MKRILMIVLLALFLLPGVLAFDSNTTLTNEWRMVGRTLDNAKYTTASGVNLSAGYIVTNYTFPYISRPQMGGAVKDGKIYTVYWSDGATQNGTVVMLDASDLSLLASYEFPVQTYFTSPVTVIDDYVYVGGYDGWVFQLNSSDLSLVATYNGTGQFMEGVPYIINSKLYIGSTQGSVYEFNASNISQLISMRNSSSETSAGALVIDDNLYIGSYDNRLYILNASNLSQQIQNYTTGGDIFGAPSYSNGWIYIVSKDKYLYQFNASNISAPYKQVWIGSDSFSSPTIAHGYVYVATFNTLKMVYQFNASDVTKQIANFTSGTDADNGFYQSASVNDQYLYIMSDNATIYQLDAFNISNNPVQLDLPVPGERGTMPVILDNQLFVGTDYNLWKVQQTGGGNINTCVNITLPGTYTLDATIYSNDDYCININSDDVTVDCGFFNEINADYSSLAQSYHKININDSSNVVIKDCLINYGHIYFEGNSKVNITADSYINAMINGTDCWASYYGDYYADGYYNICPGNYEIYFPDTNYSYMYLDGNSEVNGTGVIVHGIGNGTFMTMNLYGTSPSVATSNNTAYGFDISNFGVAIGMASIGGSFHDLKLSNNVYGLYILGSSWFTVGTKNVELYNINASNNDRGGVFAFASENMTIYDNEFNDNGFGIMSGDPYNPGLPIGNVSFGFMGINTGLIDNNEFLRNRNVGLGIMGVNTTISNNDVSYNEGLGIALFSYAQPGHYMNVTGNTVDYNNMTGILISGAGNNIIDNEIIGNGDGHTMLDNAFLQTLDLIVQLSLGQNLSSMFTVGNAYWWNGVLVAASTIPNNTDYYSDNVILDNYNYGMLFFYNASNADLYNNVICNNSKSGLNLSQISINTESIVNANESAPYNNTYCANNPYWIEYSKVLQLVISPADAITTVVGYTTNSTRSPIQVNPGLAVYLLPAVSYYNGTSLIETPYLWTVSKPGYATRQGLASMTTDETIIVNLLSGFNPTIVCPINSTTQMCQLMSESGAGLGSFIEYLGGPLMLLLLVLVIVGMIGAIGFSIVAVIKERMK